MLEDLFTDDIDIDHGFGEVQDDVHDFSDHLSFEAGDGHHFDYGDEHHFEDGDSLHTEPEHGLGDYSTMPNVFGGMNVYDGGSMVAQTTPNIFGGENVHFCASAIDSTEDLLNDSDYLANGQLVFGSPEDAFADPNDDLYYHMGPDFHAVDIDGDGNPDLIVEHFDTDGDGYHDSTMTYHIDEDGLHYEALDGEGYTYAMNLEDIETFDPAYSDDASVVGHPADAMSHWEDQGATQRCGLYSQKFIIEELTGQEIDIDKMADIASEHGWFSETNGTNPGDLNKMLDFCGIPNEMTWNNDLEDLHRVLANGGRAIVAIDADEIWHGEEDGVFSPLDSANHAVEVAGIDYSDPDNPMVILNDSGNPESGCGEMVPADKFMDAWADSKCQMVAV